MAPLVYDGLQFEQAFRMDIFVEDRVICEVKAVVEMHPIFEAQLLTYLRLTHRRLGYLINFNVPRIKAGLKRLVL